MTRETDKPGSLDHDLIREESLLELYDLGRLPTEREAAFEEHLVGCPECQDALEVHRSFARGMRTLAAEDTARAVAPLAILAWLARRSRAFQGGVLSFLAVLVVGALLWPVVRSPGRGGDGVETGTPVVLLDAYRSGGPGEGEPEATIDAEAAARPVILAVDVGADSRFADYRLTVFGPDGGEVFRRDGLRPNALEVVMATFPAGFFEAGDHRLVVEGLRSDGSPELVAERRFRVEPVTNP